MPTTSTVSGRLQDVVPQPVEGGKVVATLQGSDVFEDGSRIITSRVQATTGPDGRWSMDLLVNGEGEGASSTWSIEIFNEFAVSVYKVGNLFIATSLPITLSDLEKTSAANKRAATDTNASRLIMAATFAEYAALPAVQRRANDIILPTEV